MISILMFFSLIVMGCSIDGEVTINGEALEGVNVTLNNNPDLTTVTDHNGKYHLQNLKEGEYTIIPTLEGHIFLPPARSVTITTAGISNQNFKAVTESSVTGVPLALNDPEAIIVTTQEFEEAFRKFAILHTLTGIHTEVVTIQAICAGGCDDADPNNDTVKAIKDYIMVQSNLKYLMLGGDIEIVPSRQVTDAFFFELQVLGFPAWTFTYDETFFSDYYYADFAEWNPNGNGIYAEEEEDISDYKPEIAVSRIPVSSLLEISHYYSKVIKYLTDYDTSKMNKALLQAGVFTSFFDPFAEEFKDVSAAYYDMDEGRTNSILAPFDIIKQHQNANPVPDPEAHLYYSAGEFADAHRSFLQQGYNIVRYSDHGDAYMLAPGIYGNDIDNLINDTLPIMLSGLCNGGEFSVSDASGERAVNAPNGGGIAYIGQGAIGNSLLGSMQLLDETLRYIVTTENPILADAFFYAHDILIDVDDMFYFPLSKAEIPFVFDQIKQVITQDNYEYAQKSSVMLGDMLIPVWNNDFQKAPDIQVVKENLPTGIKLTIIPSEIITSAPIVYADGNHYGFETVGTSFELIIEPNPLEVYLGIPSKDTQYYFQELP